LAKASDQRLVITSGRTATENGVFAAAQKIVETGEEVEISVNSLN
jgi:hypothetical protein